jgi:large subunit ribosomal protein L23
MTAVAKKTAKTPKAAKAKKEAANAGVVLPRYYDVLVRPLITEKSTAMGELNKVVFAIAADATKVDVKRAVEALFNVKVAKVNTLNREGKLKRFKGALGQRADQRKAIVTLEQGHAIDFAAGAR